MKLKKGMGYCCEYGIPFLALSLIIAICVIGKPLESLDELWQYSFGSNVARGLLPYRDINMVVAPLSAIAGGAVLAVFGEQLIVYRILGVLVCAVCMMMFYDILRIMGIERGLAFCLCLYSCVFYSFYFTYDYNYSVLLILLFIMDMLLRQEAAPGKRGYIRWMLIGFSAGCAVLLKQSTGLAVSAAASVLVLVLHRGRDKVRVISYGTGCLLPLVLCAGWLSWFHIGEVFWDYAVGGIPFFRQHNKTSIWTFLFQGGPVAIIEAVLTVVILAVGVRKLIREKEVHAVRKWLIMTVLSVAGLTVVYPIADETHFAVALLPFLAMGICELPVIRDSRQRLPFGLIAVIVLAGTGMAFWSVKRDNVIWSELPHYQGVRMDVDVERMVEEMDAYIERQEGATVYILDGTAVLYKIPIDRYDKDYDICLAGDWGSRTSEEMAQALLQRGGLMLLAADGYGVNWQVPEDFLEYIKDHAICVDHIGKYDVYVAEDAGL